MTYIISDLRGLLLPLLEVLDVPPLDLQGRGGTRPTERARHLHILATSCCDVTWHFCEESCRGRKTERFEGVFRAASLSEICFVAAGNKPV